MENQKAENSTGVEAAYRKRVDAGCFVIQQCQACGKHIFYPRTLCPHCGSLDLIWTEPSGKGTVHAVTTIRRKADAGGDYNVSLIDLDEGVRMMSRVDNAIDAVHIGQRVRARVEVKEGRGLVVFDAIQEEGVKA